MSVGERSSPRARELRVEPARQRRVDNASYREPVRGEPQADPALLVEIPRLVEGARDDRVEPHVHLVLRPEVLLDPLHPLEVGAAAAAAVGEDVGQDEDAALFQDRVRPGRDGAVRSLADQPRPDAPGVGLGDDLLERAGREDVAVEEEELLGADRLGVREALERAGLARNR